MNKLTLFGELRHIDGKKYIRYCTDSGREHLLPIVCEVDFKEGTWVEFAGKLCAKSVKEGDRFHKLWFAIGDMHMLNELFHAYVNEFELSRGTVVRVDGVRVTPLTSRKIVDFVVADGDNYFNCVAFGRTAMHIAEEVKKGDSIHLLSARFCSREYTKNGEPRTAYEVVVREYV